MKAAVHPDIAVVEATLEVDELEMWPVEEMDAFTLEELDVFALKELEVFVLKVLELELTVPGIHWE